MFTFLSNLTYRRRKLVLAISLIFMAVSGVFSLNLVSSLAAGGTGSFIDPQAQSNLANQTLVEKMGRAPDNLIVLFTDTGGQSVQAESYREAVAMTLAKISTQPGVGAITTYYTTNAATFVSADRRSTYALVGMLGDEQAQNKTFKAIRPLLTSPTLQVRLGGGPAGGEEVSSQVERDLQTSELITFPIMGLLLILIFGSFMAAGLPLAIAGFAIVGAFLSLKLLNSFTSISVFAVNIITLLGMGLAIDYSLFVVSRFREELIRTDNDVAQALHNTLRTAGRTVLFSGLTVAISLLSLLVFPQLFLRSVGMGGAATVGLAVVGTLTLLPAILALLGTRVNSLSVKQWLPGHRKAGQPDTQNNVWWRISHFVMRHPGKVLIATIVPLLFLGLPFLKATFTLPDERSLPRGAQSREVGEVLRAQFSHDINPVKVVVQSPEAALSAASVGQLYDYTRQLAAVPGVRQVESLVTLDPTLSKAAYQQLYTEVGAGRPPSEPIAQAASYYARDNFSLINVLYDSEPQAVESQQLVKRLRAIDPPVGFKVQIGGNSAQTLDFLDSLARSIPVAFGLIVVVIFALLFLMLGSVVIPLKAVLLNILSLSASFGALVWVFQEGHLSDWLGFTPIGSIDGTQPVLIFVLAFGLSMDYEVFLLSRIKEQYDRSGDTVEAVALGVQKSSGIITSAALLLLVVIAGFMLGEVVFIKQDGLGLSLAVLLDATIVRTLMVPATMRLMGRYNWYAPGWLKAIYARWNLSESQAEPTGKPDAALEPELEARLVSTEAC